MTEPRTATVARVEHAALEQSILALEHDAVLEAAHTRAGQYCQLVLDAPALDGHFALIDPPGAGPLRFLLRAGGPAADALRQIPAGTRIRVHGPMGPGFPVERAQGRDVLLVSAGAGLAAIRPVLLLLVPYGAKNVWLYHGTRTLAHVPFARDLEHAHRQGARVTLAVSREPGAAFAGRVHAAIARDRPDLRGAVAFLCGQSAMVDTLRDELPSFGLDPGEIYVNY